MTAARATKLTSIGFEWEVGASKQDAVWEGWLAKLKEYKAAHGDCSVPQDWGEDPGLGSWVLMQRLLKKQLDSGVPTVGMTAVRAAKLTALGFEWEVAGGAGKRRDGTDWEDWLAKLVVYKAAHGDCRVPQDWGENPKFGRWVDRQRVLKRKLDRGQPGDGMTAARVTKLTSIGFEWEVGASKQDAGWEGWLAKLARYKAEHGDCNVPLRWGEDPGLGQWVSNQRRGKTAKRMTAERGAKLTALGFERDLAVGQSLRSGSRRNNAAWEGCLAKLAQYKVEHGDCDVPRDWAEDPKFGRWVASQQQLKEKLGRDETTANMTAARVAKLTALGFVWDGGAGGRRSAGWEDQLAKLVQYKAAHGDCIVPTHWADDPGFGQWVANQRYLKKQLDRSEPCGGMTAARAAKLTALGFVWDVGAGGRRGATPKVRNDATTDGVRWAEETAELTAQGFVWEAAGSTGSGITRSRSTAASPAMG
jgi:hypothetical protein